MNHQEYIKAIEHEQTLIRRLFAGRKKRAAAIEKITAKRYVHLIGKFFSKENDPDSVYCIDKVVTSANYVMSDQVDVVLCCSCLGTTYSGIDSKTIAGVYIHYENITFKPNVDIDEYLKGRFVDRTKAVERFDNLLGQLRTNMGYNTMPDRELTWEDMMLIHKCIKDAMNKYLYAFQTMEGQKKVYEDVLRRYKEMKENRL